MPQPSGTDSEQGRPNTPRLARLFAVIAAVAWGFFYFGLIDLLVVIIQDDRFRDFYLLETGWGLLYTVLVAMPLVAYAIRPRSSVPLQQLIVVAAAVGVCAVITPAEAQLVPALLLAMTAVALSVWSGHGPVPFRGLSVHEVDRVMAVFAAVAAVVAVGYAGSMIRAARQGVSDDDTWGLMHLPMQAAFGLSVAGVAILAVLTGSAKRSASLVPVVSAGVSAAWLGVISIVYPEHLGSLGRIGGIAAIAWGVGFIAAGAKHRQTACRPVPVPPGEADLTPDDQRSLEL
jgi:hypothetical protein